MDIIMTIQIEKIIEYENESYKVDFKKEEYPLGKNIKKNVTIQEEITIFWADVDFFRLYN